MRRVSTLPALLALLLLALGACAADPPADRGVAAPTTTTAGPDPTTAPPSTAKPKQPSRRPVPKGVAAPADRRPAPALRVTAFDGRTVTLGAFRGRPVVVNFFESW
jgi:cytochrome oxidase Cu insertion factor (SCO1/SenC/PrrC family)